MEFGIIGTWRSGKTSTFCAITGQEVSLLPTGKPQPHIATIKVPDPRVDRLTASFQPKKTTYADIKFVDIVGVKPEGETMEKKGLDEAILHHLGNVNLLMATIRAFEEPSLGPPSPEKELEEINLELVFSDLSKVEHRLPRLEKSIQKVAGKERAEMEHELQALQKIKPALDNGRPLRDLELSAEEEKILRGFQFLSAKPLLYLINIGEEAHLTGQDFTSQYGPKIAFRHTGLAQICAKLEMEIALLEDEDKQMFMQDYKLETPARERILATCFDLMEIISFFTINPNELHAWLTKKGTSAIEAAGMVHSDFERGFIRAEVIPWDSLIDVGGFAEARKAAKLRTEGKDYIVHDGDVIHFLFSV